MFNHKIFSKHTFSTKKNIYLSPLFLLLVASCSSLNEPEFDDFFRTEIRADHSKIFNFSLVMVKGDYRDNNHSDTPKQRKGGGKDHRPGNDKGMGKGENKQVGNMPTNSQSRKKSNINQINEQLTERLAIALEENNYCRKGYIELERNIGHRFLSLRGECHESATKKDRKQFPNSP
ncbi:MAG: hypothetical protein OCD00_02460 [Colwellia sp.]